jgi:hypothetical protein
VVKRRRRGPPGWGYAAAGSAILDARSSKWWISDWRGGLSALSTSSETRNGGDLSLDYSLVPLQYSDQAIEDRSGTGPALPRSVHASSEAHRATQAFSAPPFFARCLRREPAAADLLSQIGSRGSWLCSAMAHRCSDIGNAERQCMDSAKQKERPKAVCQRRLQPSALNKPNVPTG